MRVLIFSLGVTLAGCSEFPTSGGGPALGETSGSAAQTYFADYPARLFMTAEALCDGPGQNVVKPDRNQLRCESLSDPESTAAMILQFDGTVEDLPKLVIAFSARPTDEGYLMTIDSYIRVPGRDGGAQQVRFVDPRVTDNLAEFLKTAGGRPL
jgi:hypothetical protein